MRVRLPPATICRVFIISYLYTVDHLVAGSVGGALSQQHPMKVGEFGYCLYSSEKIYARKTSQAETRWGGGGEGEPV